LKDIDKVEDHHYHDPTGDKDVYFRVCSWVDKKCHSKESFSNQFDTTDCTGLTSNNTNGKDVHFEKKDIKFTVNNETVEVKRLNITYTGGEYDEVNKVNKSFTLLLSCNKSIENLTVTSYNKNSTTGNVLIEAISKHSCPTVDFNALGDFILKHKMAFAIVFVGIGLFLTFFGQKLFMVSLFLLGFIITFMVTMIAIFYFIQEGSPDWLKIVFAVLSAVLGIFVGYAISRDTA